MNYSAGDYLIFQLESGYGLLRVLEIEESNDETIWHLLAYRELFFEIEAADTALENANSLTVELPHVALTQRAFEATQTARMKNEPLTDAELDGLHNWRKNGGQISDRSIRLMLGLR